MTAIVREVGTLQYQVDVPVEYFKGKPTNTSCKVVPVNFQAAVTTSGLNNCGITLVSVSGNRSSADISVPGISVQNAYGSAYFTNSVLPAYDVISDLNRSFVETVHQQLYQFIASYIAKNLPYSVYFLSDTVTKYGLRKGYITSCANMWGFDTHQFVRWLIKNNHGIVFQCPTYVNYNHRSVENLSLIRPWLWTPPNLLADFAGGFAGFMTDEKVVASSEESMLKLHSARLSTEPETFKKKYIDII